MKQAGFDMYEAMMKGARDAYFAHPAIQEISGAEISDEKLLAWLYFYSGHGIHMTREVELWITWAGSRCKELGLERLGHVLHSHARAEAGHDQMMVDDTRAVAGRLGKTPEVILRQVPLASALRYRQMHEDVIFGDAPFCQLAIEYEIERLSITSLTDIVRNCERVLGDDPASGYSFLAEHVELDHGHTEFNKRQLAELLEARPEALDLLVKVGTRALECYADFLAECLTLAELELRTAA